LGNGGGRSFEIAERHPLAELFLAGGGARDGGVDERARPFPHLRVELAADVLARDLDERGHHGVGQVPAVLEKRLQLAVGTRLLDELVEPMRGEPRLRVAGDGAHDLVVAALDEEVGDVLGEARATRDGEEMILALPQRELDELAFGEARGALEDRARHHAGAVGGEVLDRAAGRIGNVGEALRQLDASAELEIAGEAHQHLVEDVDMPLGKGGGPLDEEIGHLSQRDDAIHLVAARDGILHLPDERPQNAQFLFPPELTRRVAESR
jgi:hypothetical protein